MSMDIDYENLTADNIDDNELRYLRDREWLLGRNGVDDELKEYILSDEAAERLAEPEEEPARFEPEVPDDAFAGMNNDELRGELHSRNLSLDGKKAELIERLVEFERAKQAGDIDDAVV